MISPLHFSTNLWPLIIVLKIPRIEISKFQGRKRKTETVKQVREKKKCFQAIYLSKSTTHSHESALALPIKRTLRADQQIVRICGFGMRRSVPGLFHQASLSAEISHDCTLPWLEQTSARKSAPALNLQGIQSRAKAPPTGHGSQCSLTNTGSSFILTRSLYSRKSHLQMLPQNHTFMGV